MVIHERIQEGQFPNSVALAQELEVGVRTIKRDVEFLRDRLHLPIAYHHAKHGYYYTRPVPQFPGVAVSEAEVFALLVAHKAIAQYHGTPFQRPLEMAFHKLTGQLDTRTRYSLENLGSALSFRPFAPEDADLKLFEMLTKALKERRAVRFQYRNLGTRTWQGRLAQPYHLACIENHWYLFAHDVNRQALRTFALSRVRQLELTPDRFQAPRDFNADEYLRGSFTVFKGRDDYEVVIEFDAWATDLIRGRQYHSSQEWIELPGGGSRLRLRLNSLAELEGWVLSWGTHATVIRPQALAERVRRTAAAVAEKYGAMAPASAGQAG